MIDPATIQRIFDTADIVEVISDFVNLKKAGQNYKGLSPFTDEKTPSFFVSPAKGIFKCFSSGIGGNVVKFLMEHDKLSYPEALRYLAKKYHIDIVEKELTPKEIAEKNVQESLLIVSSYAQKYFTDILNQHEDGRVIALSYLKERGISDEMIKKFQLGYCLDQKDGFTQAAQKNGYKLDYLIKTGLTIKKENYVFDRFSGRVIFPIHSLSGKVIGFGGRTLKADKNIAKYVNSIESEIYHKSKVLYGLFFAKNAIVKREKCFLVEGYTDVISLYQAGIENVVASSGTSLTEDQIRLIKRFTQNITVLFDGDEAGIKASLRGVDMLLEQGLNIKVVVLPDGEDPDSYSKKFGSAEFEEYINKHERDFIKFKTQLLIDDAQNDPIKKANLIIDVVRSISVIPDGITRSVFIKECSSQLDVDESILYNEINKQRRKRAEKDLKSYQRTEEQRINKSVSTKPGSFIDDEKPQEEAIIRLILNYGNHELYKSKKENNEEVSVSVAEYLIQEITMDELEFRYPLFKQIFEEYQDHYTKGNKMAEKYFIHHQDPEIAGIATDMLSINYNLSKIWAKHDNYIQTEEMKLKEIVPETLLAYKNKKVILALKDIQDKIKRAQNENEIEELQMRYIALNNLKKSLSKDLGDRIIL